MKKFIVPIIFSLIFASCSTSRKGVGCTPISQKAQKEQQLRLGSQFGYR